MPSSMCPICGKPYSGSSCPRCKRVSRSSRSHSKRSQSQEKARKQANPWRSEYSRKEYKTARQIAIQRTGGRCAACGKVCAKRRGSSWLLTGAGVTISAPSHKVEGTARITSCCFASRATTE